MNQMKYLRELSQRYPSIASASTEIINLQAILNLPKGTEHYVSDLHGEYEKFSHIVRNGSGAIKDKIDDQFGNTLTLSQKKNLAAVIYYPEQKMDLMEEELEGEELEEWYRLTMIRLITIAKLTSTKYTRSKVRKAMEPEFAYIMEELITEHGMIDKEQYFNQIIETIISIKRVRAFIAALGHLIQKLTIDQLHVIGDIYDRGPGAHRIMDCLMTYHNVDIQWGNHDILWMGAAAGNPASIANVVRICARYNNLDTLENGYGINMIPLARFAYDTYRKDPCVLFTMSGEIQEEDIREEDLNKKMHKAIAIIQFKLEGQLIQRRPDFDMDGRLLLDKINYETGTINIDGTEYTLLDHNFPTIDPENPYELTKEEEYVVEHLVTAFKYCAALQEHVRFLFAKGSMYLTCNNMVMYHGCVPLNRDGSFRSVSVKGKKYSGKALYDVLEHYVRLGYFGSKEDENYKFGQDIMWFIWSNENSPVYGKDKMATFERYFLDEKELKIETKDYYYRLIENEAVLVQILEEFGADGNKGHIVNGHMPVAVKNGESPMRCGGKLFIIDGGFSKAYQEKTGIAGYTLVSNSYGIKLVAHKPFESRDYAIRHETDIHSDTVLEKKVIRRKQVGDTDIGKQIRERIEDLKELLCAYQDGEIAEHV
ncbi:MAG: fructose-1,6-bisphosphatase [Anaerostipes sp.]|jgi:fructose-1,6-bisphosphatase-3|nr:fructose-1,6-bisphosphatase [Anaerostipes sp.]